jgi:protocatechuate 3,4-dioxygenase beta subunit
MTRRLCILLIGILLLAGTASALNPVNVAVTSSNPWITADNTDTADITIMVTDGANKAIEGANIELSVTAPWTLRDTGGTTPAGGQIVTGFLPTTTAGTAIITATVTVPGVTTVPVVQTYSQNITASLPARATNSYAGTASVGSITDITVRVTDQYGNPVTGVIKKTAVSFTTTLSGDGSFIVGKMKVKGASITLNESGYAEVDFTVKTHPGDNYVLISPPFPLQSTLINIQGIADLPPSSLTQYVNPTGRPPTLPSDGTSKFTINYQLYDRYGNPSAHRNLTITTNAGETRLITSNNEGAVTITYGPRIFAGRYTLTAQSQDNRKVSGILTLQFVSGKPTNMLLTASPQTMASLDVKPDKAASITGKVIDANGNPVMDQSVAFSIQSVNTGGYNQTKGPSLQGNGRKTTKIGEEVTAVTDEDGLATVTFSPGAFVDAKDPGFSPNAEGTAKVRARWSSVNQYLDLSYKNFPYLSVYTSVEPSTIETGQDVDVTIRVRGDGYALLPRPVDVFMVTDRSGSMAWDTPARIDQVKKAATVFSTKFDYSSDRLGQFSFGGNGGAYTDYATRDRELSKDPKLITNAISAL